MSSARGQLPSSLTGLVLYGVLVIAAYYLLIVLYTSSHNRFAAIYASSNLSPSIGLSSSRRLFSTDTQKIQMDPLSDIIRPKRNFCAEDPFLMVFVHSRTGNYANRALIRTTWGNPQNYPHTRIELVFFIGYPDYSQNGAVMRDVLQEMDYYQDTVLFPVLDTYLNVTKKALSALEFVSSNCPRTPFVLKTDDDVVVNLFSVNSLLQKGQQGRLKPFPTANHNKLPHANTPALVADDLLLCLVWPNAKPYRNESNKWYISPDLYPNDTYPLTCSGSAWIMSMRVMHRIYLESKKAEEFPFDDVMITGFLAQKTGAEHLQIGHHYELNVDDIVAKESGPRRAMMTDKVVFHTSDKNTFQSIWLSVLSGPDVEIRPTRT